MNVYFDESGQSGCVLKKDDFLNFKDSPSFALAGIVVDDSHKQILEDEYVKFKKKFNIVGEIKGTDLLTRSNNDKLDYFLKNILPKLNVYINIYDKRFYLSTLMLASFMGLDVIDLFKYDFYHQASILAKQEDDFFIKYLDFIDNPTVKSFRNYLSFIIEYDYKFFNGPNGYNVENILVVLANKIKNEKWEANFVNDFMTYGWYKDEHITNLVNLNCLCESIFVIKSKFADKIKVVHDRIIEFEDVIQCELLSECKCELSFEDSKDNLLLQITDNVVSIFRHLYDKGIYHFSHNEMWYDSSVWDLKMLSIIQDTINVNHIKYTVPLCDWALCFCIRDMFSKEFPINQKNNLYFNLMLSDYYARIVDDLSKNTLTLNDVNEVLNN